MDGAGAAARHVGPPRTLDVQQFAAARSSELQCLYKALKARNEKLSEAVGQPSSSLTTPRHLRRRTASHNRRVPLRFRHSAAQSGNKKNEKEKTGASVSQSNAASIAAEEEACRKRKKPEKRIPSRRVRRRIELQKLRDGTASCMRDGTRRLATHVWHAKRFPMTKTWGCCLPDGLPGRGRGSKAVFKWVKEAAVLHDSSYMGLIDLQGTEDAILGVLCQMLEPPPGRRMSGLRLGEEEMHGMLYGNAVLHDVGKAPREAIAPVTTLWRPLSSPEQRGADEEEPFAAQEGAREERQLWIWVHPSAFDSALLALSTECERQGMNDPQASVKCRSRRGELARLDILGSRAFQVLQKVLRPVPRKSSQPNGKEIEGVSRQRDVEATVTASTPSDISHLLSARIFAKADRLPGEAVLALEVRDPRDTPRSFYAPDFSEVSQNGVSDNNLTGEETLSPESNPAVDSRADEGLTHWENLVGNGLSDELLDSPYLWSPEAERKVAALSQKAFSEKRRKRRKAFFTGIDGKFLHSNLEPGGFDGRVEQSGACPILLLKGGHSRPSASGWSIIMPITWVQAFWVPLVFAGGHVIGLRERHWLATDAGLPYFPHDFPDCASHAQHLEIESAAFNNTNQARPPSKRAPSFSVSPLQRSVIDAHRDRLPDRSEPPAAADSKPIDETNGRQLWKQGLKVSERKDPDGDTEMAEADTLAVSAASPSVIFPKRSAPLAEKPVHEVESSQDTAPPAIRDCDGAEKEVSPESATLEKDTAIISAPTTFISAPVTHQTVDRDPSLELTVALGADAVSEGAGDRAPSPPVQSIDDGALSPNLANLDDNTAMTGIESLELNQPIDGTNVQQIIESLSGDNAVTVNEVLPDKALPSPMRSDGVDRAVVLDEFTRLNGNFAEAGIDAQVCQTLSPGTAHNLTEGLNVQRSLEPPDDKETTPSGVRSSPTAPKFEKPILDAPGRGVEMMGTQSPEPPNGEEEPEIVENVGRSGDENRSSWHVPSSPGDQLVLPVPSSPGDLPVDPPGQSAEVKSATERSPWPVFVARTMDALTQVFKDAGLQHALLLCTGSMKYGGVPNGLRQGALQWRPSHEGVSDNSSKTRGGVGGSVVQGCCVRVLIVVPRKGVMEQNGVLCSPTKDDFDAFLSRSQQWQGVETSWLNKRKGKRKRKSKGQTRLPATVPSSLQADDCSKVVTRMPLDMGCDQSSAREAIGCITSTGPQGSAWSATGVCELSSLMKLRAAQWQDQRWWKKKEILLLAGHKLSPILRPVLASVVLESGPEQDILC